MLATPGLDRHLTYVALSRHRDSAELHYAREQFSSREALVGLLSRARPKDMASDYLGRDAELPVGEREPKKHSFKDLIDAAADRARAQRGSRESDPSLEISAITREVAAGMVEREKSGREQEAARQRETDAQRTHEQQQRGVDRER